jgi:hypothetical protein
VCHTPTCVRTCVHVCVCVCLIGCSDLELVEKAKDESHILWFGRERGPDGEMTYYRFCEEAKTGGGFVSAPLGANKCINLEMATIVMERNSASGKVQNSWQPDLACFAYWYACKPEEDLHHV